MCVNVCVGGGIESSSAHMEDGAIGHMGRMEVNLGYQFKRGSLDHHCVHQVSWLVNFQESSRLPPSSCCAGMWDYKHVLAHLVLGRF